MKQGRPDAAKAFLEQNSDAYAKSTLAQRFIAEEGKFNAAIKAVQNSPTLSADEKADRIARIRAARTKLAGATGLAGTTTPPASPP